VPALAFLLVAALIVLLVMALLGAIVAVLGHAGRLIVLSRPRPLPCKQ